MQNKKRNSISIIIMFHNHETYVEDALRSVYTQKHNYKEQIIICDDASTDGTRERILEWTKGKTNITLVFRDKNIGLIKNRTELIMMCNGEYIFILDGDDYFLPGKIRRQVKYLEDNPDKDICTTDYYQYLIDDEIVHGENERKTSHTPFRNVNACHSDMCFRRELIQRYITEVRPAEKIWELDDVPFTIWLERNANIGIIEKNYYVIRIISGSQSRPYNKDINWWENRYRWQLDMYRFFSQGSKEEIAFINKQELIWKEAYALKNGDGGGTGGR